MNKSLRTKRSTNLSAHPADLVHAGLEVNVQHTLGGYQMNIQAQFSARGITAVYGPSGSGKSTLLNIIAGFIQPNQPSEVFFNQQPWLQKNGSMVPVHRRRIAYVTQQAGLLPHLNVADNLAYGLKRNKYRTGATPSQPPASFSTLSRELQLEHLLYKYPAQLSGGEQQRVAIGRALLSNPQLILFDEPVSALDEASRENTLALLEKLHRLMPVPCIYVTHNLDELMRLANEVLIIDAGQAASPRGVAAALCDPALPLSQQYGCGVIHDARIATIDDCAGTVCVELAPQIFMHCVATTAVKPGAQVRMRIYAKDVSIALSKATDSSILNILPATVQSIEDYRVGQVLVTLDCGGCKIMSVITKKSQAELALQQDKAVYAQIKGIAVLGAHAVDAQNI